MSGNDGSLDGVMRLLHGGGEPDVVEWEARTERDLGVLIRRYLAEHPAPGSSQVADDLNHWAQQLRDDGQARLEVLGLQPFRPGDAQAG